MTEARASLYHRDRYPAEIIAEAVWLYFRFPLSFGMVEDMLAYRRILVTHKTVYEWVEKFGREYAKSIRRRTPRKRRRSHASFRLPKSLQHNPLHKGNWHRLPQ
jgi:putative transposase